MVVYCFQRHIYHLYKLPVCGIAEISKVASRTSSIDICTTLFLKLMSVEQEYAMTSWNFCTKRHADIKYFLCWNSLTATSNLVWQSCLESYMRLLSLRQPSWVGKWGHKNHLLFPKPCVHDWAKTTGPNSMKHGWDTHWECPRNWLDFQPRDVISRSPGIRKSQTNNSFIHDTAKSIFQLQWNFLWLCVGGLWCTGRILA